MKKKDAPIKIRLGPSEARRKLPEPSDPRGAIAKFRAFMRANPVKGRANIKALIREGRE
jgi:hypothetical protein